MISLKTRSAVAALALAGATMVTLAACNRKAEVACSAGSAQDPVVSIVKDQLERDVVAKLRNQDNGGAISHSAIRAAIGQLVIAIEDIRTSKEDPNSTKRFCTGTLKLRIPEHSLTNADASRQQIGLNSVSQLADQSDIERQADAFTHAIDFDVQPTDDGSKVFAETESGNPMFDFAAEVIASDLLRSTIENAQRQQQLQQDQQQAAQTAAQAAQRVAGLAAAKTDDQLANQTIDAQWKALPHPLRAQLLAAQRAWAAKKDADCRVQAAAASTDPSEMEAARLNCDAQATRDRTAWLQQQGASSGMPSSTANSLPEMRPPSSQQDF